MNESQLRRELESAGDVELDDIDDDLNELYNKHYRRNNQGHENMNSNDNSNMNLNDIFNIENENENENENDRGIQDEKVDFNDKFIQGFILTAAKKHGYYQQREDRDKKNVTLANILNDCKTEKFGDIVGIRGAQTLKLHQIDE